MKVHFADLERINHCNDGSWGTFYYKNEKFDGIVYDTIGDKPYWIFSVKDGLQNGTEYTFYEKTDIIEQICEYRDNHQFGISKEFDEQGELQSVSIIYDNSYLKTIEIDDTKVDATLAYDGRYGDRLPSYLVSLLKLSTEDLINYEFIDDNPFLTPPYTD